MDNYTSRFWMESSADSLQAYVGVYYFGYKLNDIKLASVIKKKEDIQHFCSSPRILTFGTINFLAGISIETISKALMILLFENGTIAKPDLGTYSHNTTKIYDTVKPHISFVLNTNELELIKKMQTYVRWKGKYPAPINTQEVFDSIKEYSADIHLQVKKIWLKFYDEIIKLDSTKADLVFYIARTIYKNDDPCTIAENLVNKQLIDLIQNPDIYYE